MRKILTKILFMGLIVTMVYSCKKNVENAPTNHQKVKYTAEELSIWHKLVQFNQKVKTGVRDEEFITPDSAMWYLEALFNVTQGVDTTFDDVDAYTKNYSLQVNANGTVNMSDVISVYNQMLIDLNSELSQINTDYKFLIIADLSEEPSRDGNYLMVLNSGIGFNPLALYAPITTDDNWRYGNMLGKCQNTQWDSDAGLELKRRFNHPSIVYEGNSWINVEHSSVLTPEMFPGRIYGEIATSAPCIEYTELQHYLTEGYYLFFNTSSESPVGVRPAGKFFHLMELWTNGNNPNDNHYWHHYQAWYGVPVILPPIGD